MNVQKPLVQKLVAYFKHLDVNEEQTYLYIYLLENGSSSVLQLSKGIGSGRTKLYPLLEDLANKQLVAIHERHYGTTYEALPVTSIEFLLNEREQRVANLRANLPAVKSTLQQLANQSPQSSKIIEYRGIDGLKQMNFNLSKASSEFRVFELAGLDKHLGKHFAERMRQRFQAKQLTSYDLTNNPSRLSEPGIDSTRNQVRYIDPTIFSIEFETYIYDTVVGLLSYQNDDIFGVEIYNQKFAQQQRAVFDMMWRLAKPLTRDN